VSAETLDGISQNFLLNYPEIYDFQISEKSRQLYPNILTLANGAYSTESVCVHGVFQTPAAMKFIQFAKSTEWNNELYSACVAPQLQNSLLVESWIRGHEEPPFCPSNGYSVLDIKNLDFGQDGSWSEYNDHSKWAIGLQDNWVCLGSINRMSSQYGRGGGTFCFQEATLFSHLNNAITYTTSCAQKLRGALPQLKVRSVVQ
jgi:deoxyribonuclease-2